MRPDGTPRSSANLLALRPRGFELALEQSARMRNRIHISHLLMVVDDLHVVGITLAKLEADPPGAVHRHRPLIPACSLELVQADALERTQVAQSLSDVQRQERITARTYPKQAIEVAGVERNPPKCFTER